MVKKPEGGDGVSFQTEWERVFDLYGQLSLSATTEFKGFASAHSC